MRKFLTVVLVASACSQATAAPIGAPSSTLGPLPELDVVTTTAPPETETVTATSSTEVPGPPIFLTWVSGRLPADFGGLIAAIDGVEDVTVVSAGIADLVTTHLVDGGVLAPPSGFAYPLETFAVDAATYSVFLPDEAAAMVEKLSPDEVILSETSARIRGVSVDAVLEFDVGSREVVAVRVAGVLADELVGAAEIVTVAGDDVAPGRLTPRYALVRGETLTASELRSGLAAELGADAPFQVKEESETTLLRHADAVRPQSWIKERFGEFAYRDVSARRIAIDPDWLEENIVRVDIPLLGTANCHRDYVEILTEVMVSLEAAGMSEAIDRSAYQGCWNPRWISDRRGLSRHAWGVAADINFFNSMSGGPGSPVHPALLDQMTAAGVTSGHTWVQADPGHFEWYVDP